MSGNEPAFGRCVLCGGSAAELVAEVTSRPPGETDFGIDDSAYLRRIYRCRACGVFLNRHGMLADGFYVEEYHQATYGSDLMERFRRIMALPDAESDNKRRVARVSEFLAREGRRPEDTAVLDVGSGLAVFGAEMKARGFSCVCLEPDIHAARHAIEHAGVDEAHPDAFEDYRPERRFDLVTFNKVLEHVDDPISMLSKALECVEQDGSIYVEVPDGEAAARADGGIVNREELYIEHVTAFDPTSLEYLVENAGFSVQELKSVHEPSDKFTLYAFARPPREIGS